MPNMGILIADWHRLEMATPYHLDEPGILMGCPLWGDSFVTDFLDYCLPSLMQNRISPTSIVLFVDGKTEHQLRGLGLRTIRLPDAIANRLPAEGEQKYPLLAAAHNLLIHKAAEAGAGFHMLVADSIYSNRYFDGLHRLSSTHDAIAHTGFAVVGDTGKPVLDHFRRGDRLNVTAETLGQIGWEHLNPQWASWTMDGLEPESTEEMPNSHYIHWRGRDHVRIHCAHQSAAWISPERCKKLDGGVGGTVDSELPRYMAGDFYEPTLADEMTYVVIAGATEPTPRVPFSSFAGEFWRFIGDNRAFLPYFMAPCVVPVPYDESAPSDDELDLRLSRLMERLEDGR